MFGKARLALALLAILAAVEVPAAADPHLFPKQHRTTRATVGLSGMGTCTFEITWSKEPSADDTQALQLSGTASCPAGVSYHVDFFLSDEAALEPVMSREAGGDGTVSFSARYKHPKTLHKYFLDLEVTFGDYYSLNDPSGICHAASGSFDNDSCRLFDKFIVKRGNDLLGRTLSPLPI